MYHHRYGIIINRHTNHTPIHRSLPTHNRANQHPSINHSCDLLCQSRNWLFHPLFIDFHSHVITAAVHFISPIILVSVACNHRGHHSSLPPSPPPRPLSGRPHLSPWIVPRAAAWAARLQPRAVLDKYLQYKGEAPCRIGAQLAVEANQQSGFVGRAVVSS